ncbi:dienelactone hydrolase family protein [Desertihabitans aurantiacus]|uniref:dienelactone hydrolase family protein n=1 Tax=Desertihabitans aurantiacus TaxID=2282477 RepID=UPI000DF76D6F|nr:dienelactone hydrolase family protein [Desertihabitans aurantiacus]
MTTPRRIDVDTPDGPMPADWFAPRAEPAATVVLFQEIFGVTDYIHRRSRDLVAEGYGVLVPHLYWRLGEGGTAPVVTETDGDALERAMGLAQRLELETAVADGVSAVETVRRYDGSTGLGLLGFCFGGGVAFAVAARVQPDVLISYYGSALPSLLDLAPQVTCPSLHHFGDADAFIDADARARIREAVSASGATWMDHPGANHAFDNHLGAWHHHQAAVNAWHATTEFLDDHLPTAAVPHPS